MDANGSCHIALDMCSEYIDTDNRRHGQQKTCCTFLIFILISVKYYLRDTAKAALHEEGMDERLDGVRV